MNDNDGLEISPMVEFLGAFNKLSISGEHGNALTTGHMDNEWRSLQNMLVDNLISLDSPYITDKMFAFLNNAQRLSLLVGIVTRRQAPTGGGSRSSVDVVDTDDKTIFRWRRTPNVYDAPEGPLRRFWHASQAIIEQRRQTSSGDDVATANSDNADAMRRSFMVMALLTGLQTRAGFTGQEENFVEQPSEACLQFSRNNCGALFALLMDAFHPDSQASLFHVCKCMDILLRHHTDELLISLMENRKTMRTVLETLLDYIHCACVGDLVQALLCPIPRSTKDMQQRFYRARPSVRGQYFKALGSMNVLLMITEHIWLPSAPEAHRAAAAELLECIVGKFSGVEGCSDILAALVRSPELLQGLTDVACGKTELKGGSRCATGEDDVDDWFDGAGASGGGSGKKKVSNSNKKKGGKGKTKTGGKKTKANQGQKAGTNATEVQEDENKDVNQVTAAASGVQGKNNSTNQHTLHCEAALDALRSIIELATKSTVPPTEPHEYMGFAETASQMVPCQLSPVSERLFTTLEPSLVELCDALVDPGSAPPPDLEMAAANVKHSSYTVAQPLSNHRLELVKLIVACVTHKPKTLMPKLSRPKHWKTFVQWFFQYPHSNMYHVEFRALFNSLLHFAAVDSGVVGGETLKLVLLEYGLLKNVIALLTDDEAKRVSNASGHALLIWNALRLHRQASAPDSVLASILDTMPEWQQSALHFEEETRKLTAPWPASSALHFSGGDAGSLANYELRANTIDKLLHPNTADTGIDLGSEFADLLGFRGVTTYDPTKPRTRGGGGKRQQQKKKR